MDNRPDLPSETFCILPWVHLFAGEQGILRPCCMTLKQRTLLNRNANGEPYIVYHPSGIEEAWNSPTHKELRRDMLAGRRPPVCQPCFRNEDLGIWSYRQNSNVRFQHQIADAVAQTTADGAAPSELISSADFRLGNLCNLRCRMCTPVSSKGLIREWAEFHGLSADDERLARLRKLDWYTKDAFWQIFEKYVPHIERLHFAGGEPLIIPQMFDFLERVIEMGRADAIKLLYITNLTIFPKRVFDLWPHFKKVTVTVSLDGFDRVNSYIRYPSNWKTLDQHMRRIDAEAKRLNCWGRLNINSTIQAYNIFRVDELLEYAATAFEAFNPPTLSILALPEHHSIQILPPEMKECAADRLYSFKTRFADRWPRRWQGEQLGELLASIDGVIEHIFEADRSEALPEFRRWTNHFDQSRGENIQRAIPELAPLFEN